MDLGDRQHAIALNLEPSILNFEPSYLNPRRKTKKFENEIHILLFMPAFGNVGAGTDKDRG